VFPYVFCMFFVHWEERGASRGRVQLGMLHEFHYICLQKLDSARKYRCKVCRVQR
jgi:hypothetical protein